MDMKLFALLAGYVQGAIGKVGGAVISVNGKTGEVNLTASDVNAAPATRAIPTGGSTGDALLKKSNSNYDVEWINLLNKFYPVGSIYQSVNSTSPATLFGGTWVQIKDVFLLACGDTYAAGATGGEAAHTLTRAELPNEQLKIQRGDYNLGFGAWAAGGNNSNVNYTTAETGLWHTEALGSGSAHNNMPPYEAVYCWKRTA